VRRAIDDHQDDHPDEDDERPPASWAVGLSDDCEGCEDLRVLLTLEEVGRAGYGVVAHLSPDSTRRLRGALGRALKEIGEPLDA
jgi:hypothetical protein